ncbi:MAG: AraC family transcriptional regulator [Bacteroidales bacterium]|nr:AraC family transcriptional regulator [Bacteroidales bacterium]
MEDYFKYLTHSHEDVNWGLFLNVAGTANILAGSEYPPTGHPKGYHFSWSNGRILQEFQINYITDGEGIMETSSEKYQIKPGMILIIRPNVWHRYRPVKSKGWKEHYIGFQGDFAARLIEKNEQLNKSPVIHIGFNEDILSRFLEVISLVKSERPAYQHISAGLVIQILGQIIALIRNKNFWDSPIENSIQKSCLMIRDNMYQTLKIKDLAKDLGVNYSLFRKSFKKYTGLSPNQYHLALRIKQASFQLVNTNYSIKEISFNLGFCSVFYFSKLYKKKTGMSPSTYRKNYSSSLNRISVSR